MTKNDFTQDQSDSAIDFVAADAMDRAEGRPYTLVFDAAGLDAPQDLHADGRSELVTVFMKAFHDRCKAEGLPPLDSLVVHVDGARAGHPGAGYFAVNKLADPFGTRGKADEQVAAFDYWRAEKAECMKWGERQRGSGL